MFGFSLALWQLSLQLGKNTTDLFGWKELELFHVLLYHASDFPLTLSLHYSVRELCTAPFQRAAQRTNPAMCETLHLESGPAG